MYATDDENSSPQMNDINSSHIPTGTEATSLSSSFVNVSNGQGFEMTESGETSTGSDGRTQGNIFQIPDAPLASGGIPRPRPRPRSFRCFNFLP